LEAVSKVTSMTSLAQKVYRRNAIIKFGEKKKRKRGDSVFRGLTEPMDKPQKIKQVNRTSELGGGLV